MITRQATPAKVTFRPICDADIPFLKRLYASTREDEMAMLVDWSDQQKTEFLDMQFKAQHTFYMEQFTKAEFGLILLRGKPAGRLYLDRREAEIRLIDIALLPKHRGKGLGGKLMRDILAEGQSQRLAVRIHVERNNPAMHLYDRLGFQRIEDQGVYFLMEWKPVEDESEAKD